MIYGYARVSTAFEQSKDRNQTFDRQEKILNDYGVKSENIFCDRISGGKSTKVREAYERLMQVVIPGDIIVVSEMSRFSRSLVDLIMSINNLIENQIGIVFIKEHIQVGTNGMTPMDKLTIHIMGAFAEFERSLIGSRVHEGMQASKAKGKKLGRPSKITPELESELVDRYFNYKWNYERISKEYNLSMPTVCTVLKKYRTQINVKGK